MHRNKLLIVAGEVSGDSRGARLVDELRQTVPQLDCFGLGGEELAAAGVRLIGRSSEIAVVGLVEALRVLFGRASCFIAYSTRSTASALLRRS